MIDFYRNIGHISPSRLQRSLVSLHLYEFQRLTRSQDASSVFSEIIGKFLCLSYNVGVIGKFASRCHFRIGTDSNV